MHMEGNLDQVLLVLALDLCCFLLCKIKDKDDNIYSTVQIPNW
jgi:hypothetical protein